MADLIQRREKEAMNYLLRQKKWQNPQKPPVPFLILLDIIFQKNFLKVMRELQQNPTLKNLFTIVLISSKNNTNIIADFDYEWQTYYAQKPSQLDQLKKRMKLMLKYWFEWRKYRLNKAKG
jgi:hypothetical protein